MKLFILVFFLLINGLEAADKKRKVVPQPFKNNHGMWTGPIVIGTPKQPQDLHLDTTSSDFFFIDSNCKTNGCTKNRKGFDGSKSSTFKEIPFRIPFGTTHMGSKQTGRFTTDCLTGLGLAKPPRIPFPLVERTSGGYTESYGDGVIGLGFKDGGILPGSFFQLMLMLFEGSLYSFHVDKFNHKAATGFEDSGFGIYGGVDRDNCDESTAIYHKISKPKKWMLKIEKFVAGTLTLSGGHALVKPGPFEIYGPSSEIQKIYKAVNAKQEGKEYTVDCNIIGKLPPLQLIIDGKTHKIASSDYTIQSDDDKTKCYLLFKVIDSKTANGADWILGDVLFRNRCVVFDFKKHSIGFTARK